MPRSLLRLLPLLIATGLATTAALAADFDLVRQNFVGYYTAAGANGSSQRTRDGLASLEAQARQLSAAGFLLSDGSWSDINYSETPSGSWSPWDHTRRLIVLARAYRTPGQALYRDPQLRSQIEAALAYTSVYYGVTKWPTGNWWFWTIGVPLDLGPTLVLMRGDISAKTYDDCVNEIYLRIGSSPASRGIVGPTPVGENLVWSGATHLALALLKDDPAMLGRVRDAMASVTLPSSATDGIKPDASFQQHGPQLYTGGYGGSFAADVTRYMLFTRDTSYALPPASLDSFANYVADGIAWALYGNYFDVSVISREVARNSSSGFQGLAALLQASVVATARQHEIQSAAAMMLKTWGGLPVELAGLADAVARSGAVPAWPAGHRHYYASDYTVHRRDGWFASIKMFSTRTMSGERTNGENILGSRQSDGRLYLVLDGDEYFGRDVWPVIDWARLPGITVEQKSDTANDTYGFGTNAYAGGTGDARNGVSAMQAAPLNASLKANKSWFFFDDAIVFLASGITDTSANPVETVVNQWPLLDPASPLIVQRAGGETRWALCERVGYYFPIPALLQTKRETRSGTWAALGGSSDMTPRSAPVVTMWLDHGVHPTNASAAYVIVPGATQQTMEQWTAADPIAIDANGVTVSAARDRRTGALGIAFWTAGSVDGFSSDAPALVWATQSSPASMSLSVADPLAGSSGVIRVTVPGRWTTSAARVVAADAHATTIEVPRLGGQTASLALTAPVAGVRRRAAR